MIKCDRIPSPGSCDSACGELRLGVQDRLRIRSLHSRPERAVQVHTAHRDQAFRLQSQFGCGR